METLLCAAVGTEIHPDGLEVTHCTWQTCQDVKKWHSSTKPICTKLFVKNSCRVSISLIPEFKPNLQVKLHSKPTISWKLWRVSQAEDKWQYTSEPNFTPSAYFTFLFEKSFIALLVDFIHIYIIQILYSQQLFLINHIYYVFILQRRLQSLMGSYCSATSPLN